MALTVVKYRKSETGEAVTPAILIKSKIVSQQQQIVKKPVIKLQGNPSLIINKIPATIKPAMKRSSDTSLENTMKSSKFPLQTIASAGTPLTSFQWQRTIGGGGSSSGGTTITATPTKKILQPNTQQQIGAAISSLPPNTIIQATSGTGGTAGSINFLQTNGGAGITTTTALATTAVRRPTIYIKRETLPKRTIRSVTLELIEKNPFVHLGVSATRLPLLKNVICDTAGVALVDCYITLKKLRQNEEFALLAEYFEMTEAEVQQAFVHSVAKLARYLRFLIRWPDSKKYYDRHKNMPFAFRSNLSHVQSLIECVETDMQRPMQIDCSNYKFILSITTTGVISYISEAFVGHHDDLTIFNASKFQSVIPKYLSLVADPGKGIRRKRKPKSAQSKSKNKNKSSSSITTTTNNNKSNSKNKNSSMETDSTTDSADESADDLDDNTDDTDDGRSLSRYAASRVAAEMASHQTLNVVNSELTSRKVKNFSIPTMRVREPVCRLQIRHMIYCLREYKILQPYAIQEPLLYQYLNEILIVIAALTNLQR